MRIRRRVFVTCVVMFLCTAMIGCGQQKEKAATDESGITSADEKIVNDIKKDIPQNATKADIYKDKDGNISFEYETEDGGGGGGMVLK
jgi:hypothetical protein